MSLEDGGWDGVAWAFLDARQKKGGKSSARVQFTVNSLNKQTGELNAKTGRIAWRYVGPPIEREHADKVALDLMPARAVDVNGNQTVASKFISIRVADGAGKTLIDTRIDPEGKMQPLQWHRPELKLADPHDGRIASIELYVDMSLADVPWDQRLTVWVDRMVISR